jgi:serine/threonine protein kinase
MVVTDARNLRSAARLLEGDATPTPAPDKKLFNITWIIVIVIVVAGIVASYFLYRYCKKRQDEEDAKNGKKKKKGKEKKKKQQEDPADLESGERKSWKRSDNPTDDEETFQSEMDRQAEMEQVRSVASAIQMGMQMGLQNTQNVHSNVKSVLLKKNEEKQEERNQERVWQAIPDLSLIAADSADGGSDALRKSEALNDLDPQPGADLDGIDIMTSNLLASQMRKSKSGPLATKMHKAKSRRGNFILAGWQVKSKDIEHIEDVETENSQSDLYSKPASQFTYTFVKVGGITMACKKLDASNSKLSSVAEQQIAVRRLMVETRTLAELQHPNIVRLLGVCNEAGVAKKADEDDDIDISNSRSALTTGPTMCVLTEIAPRGDLRTLLDAAIATAASTPLPAGHHGISQELPLWLRLRMLKGISLAVRHAHAHLPSPILHRDLRPCNIIIAHDWTARVTEWGLASGASGEFTGSGYGGPGGIALGVLGIDAVPFTAGMAYQAPEVLTVSVGMGDEEDEGDEDIDQEEEEEDVSGSRSKQAAANAIDEAGWSTKGDVYSFGVLAWELLGGSRPWHSSGDKNSADHDGDFLIEEAVAASAPGAMTAERIYGLVVKQQKRPHGYTPANAANAAAHDAPLSDLAASMPLLRAEAAEKSTDGNGNGSASSLLAKLEGSGALSLITECWAADRRTRPTMADVSTALSAAEEQLAELEWGEASTAGGDMAKDLEAALGMVEGSIGGGRSSTSAADVDMLMQRHRKLAAEAEARAMAEVADEADDVIEEEEDLTDSTAGFDLTSSFANFYKGAFAGGGVNNDEGDTVEP